MDRALLRVARRQIQSLKTELANPPNPDSILSMSANLRSLLVDGEGVFRSAWREFANSESLPMEPRIQGYFVDQLLALPKFKQHTGSSFVVSGRAKLQGMEMGPFLFIDVVLTEEDLRKHMQLLYKEQLYGVGKYNAAISISYNGLSISKEEVIKYAANKLGGVHYDKKRGGDSDSKRDRRGRVHKVLDAAFDYYRDNPQGMNLPFNFGNENANGLHLALLSIASEVATSPDTDKLLELITKTVPESSFTVI